MILKRKLMALCCLVFISNYLNAQIEVAHLVSKDMSATGFGAFLNIGVPISEGSSVTAEGAFYVLKQKAEYTGLVPVLLGYRHTFDGSGAGFYMEPIAGYNFGRTDVEIKKEAGSYVERIVKGPTAGIGTGYILPGNFPLNIGLRYQHIFVSGDPALNLISLRLSYALSFGRRD